MSSIPVPISPPHPDETIKEETPSPQAVNEFTNSTTGGRTDVVSDLISDQLVTDYVGCGDGDINVNVGLPQLSTPTASKEKEIDSSDDNRDEKLDTPYDETRTNDTYTEQIQNQAAPPLDPCSTTPTQTSNNTSPTHHPAPTIILGPERRITFHTESLGIKLSRHTDGYVRILSISPYRPSDGITTQIRTGELKEGDLIRQVSDVCLRKPIDSNVWKLTVGLIKMAPRPLEVIVATEYTEVEDVRDAQCALHLHEDGNGSRQVEVTAAPVGQRCQLTGQTVIPTSPKMEVGETRQIVFYEECLGVKLHHTARGYVVVHSVVPIDASAGDKPPRSGDLRQGDVVLEVGGVWDLYHPISVNAWAILVKFIRECRRPMRMVVGDQEYLSTVQSPGSTVSSCDDGDDSVVSNSPGGCSSSLGDENDGLQLSPCSLEDKKTIYRIDEGEESGNENDSKGTVSTDELSTECTY